MDKVLQFTPISAMKAVAKLPLMVLDKLKELDDPWLVAMDRTRYWRRCCSPLRARRTV